MAREEFHESLWDQKYIDLDTFTEVTISSLGAQKVVGGKWEYHVLDLTDVPPGTHIRVNGKDVAIS